jgi:hypothetical protein
VQRGNLQDGGVVEEEEGIFAFHCKGLGVKIIIIIKKPRKIQNIFIKKYKNRKENQPPSILSLSLYIFLTPDSA